jgi:uncharacterized protein involved in exopolysaccharide biosynthesis
VSCSTTENLFSSLPLFTLAALLYALFATPVYQADALIQVEQKQGNALLSNLSEFIPDSSPESARSFSFSSRA